MVWYQTLGLYGKDQHKYYINLQNKMIKITIDCHDSSTRGTAYSRGSVNGACDQWSQSAVYRRHDANPFELVNTVLITNCATKCIQWNAYNDSQMFCLKRRTCTYRSNASKIRNCTMISIFFVETYYTRNTLACTRNSVERFKETCFRLIMSWELP